MERREGGLELEAEQEEEEEEEEGSAEFKVGEGRDARGGELNIQQLRPDLLTRAFASSE